jgi:hypothetical protein
MSQVTRERSQSSFGRMGAPTSTFDRFLTISDGTVLVATTAVSITCFMEFETRVGSTGQEHSLGGIGSSIRL